MDLKDLVIFQITFLVFLLKVVIVSMCYDEGLRYLMLYWHVKIKLLATYLDMSGLI